jgi:hypothetical protein
MHLPRKRVKRKRIMRIVKIIDKTKKSLLKKTNNKIRDKKQKYLSSLLGRAQ